MERRKLLPARKAEFNYNPREINGIYNDVPVSGAFNEELISLNPSSYYANDNSNCNDANPLMADDGFVASCDPRSLQGKIFKNIKSQSFNDVKPENDFISQSVFKDEVNEKRDIMLETCPIRRLIITQRLTHILLLWARDGNTQTQRESSGQKMMTMRRTKTKVICIYKYYTITNVRIFS